MKKIFQILAVAIAFFPIMSMANVNSDTVVIELEGGSKLIIYTNSKKELKALENYDFNKMIADLNKSVDSTGSSYFEITDEDGNTYKKEARIVYSDGDDSRGGDDSYRTRTRRYRDDDYDDDDDDDWLDRRRRSRGYFRRTRNNWNVEIGITNWLENGEFPSDNDAPYTVQPWGSWYLALNSDYKSPIAGPLALQWGFGLSWSNFRFQDERTILTEGVDAITFTQLDPVLDAKRSKLNVWHLNVKAVPMLDFGEPSGKRRGRYFSRGGARIGLGGYAGYRIGSSTKIVFEDGGDKEKDRDRDNFFLHNIRYGVRFQFGYRAFDLFANYDLNNVFVDNRGPDLNAFSFGLIF